MTMTKGELSPQDEPTIPNPDDGRGVNSPLAFWVMLGVIVAAAIVAGLLFT